MGSWGDLGSSSRIYDVFKVLLVPCIAAIRMIIVIVVFNTSFKGEQLGEKSFRNSLVRNVLTVRFFLLSARWEQ